MTQESKVWLITGADKGLGLSVARTALGRGDRVVVTVLGDAADYALEKEFPERCRAVHLDMLDTDAIPDAITQAQAAFGRIDILVNNAGYGLLAVAEETTAAQYRPLFEVLFFALVEVTRHVLPGMRAQRSGHIINLSSVAGFGVGMGFSFYGAAKFAVEGYSEGLAAELAPLGIAVTIIEPGGFRSDFAGPSLASGHSTTEDYAHVASYIGDYTSSRHGNQANDPALFGPAISRLVDAEQPPLRLPLGEDAVAFVRAQIAQVSANVDAWEELSASTTIRS